MEKVQELTRTVTIEETYYRKTLTCDQCSELVEFEGSRSPVGWVNLYLHEKPLKDSLHPSQTKGYNFCMLHCLWAWLDDPDNR